MPPLPKIITIGDKYRPAIEITDQAEADAYFELCVEHSMSFGRSREEAEKVERISIGYYAAYYSHETRVRVERLYRCEHPILGSAAKTGPLSFEEALNAGMSYAARLKGELN